MSNALFELPVKADISGIIFWRDKGEYMYNNIDLNWSSVRQHNFLEPKREITQLAVS